MFPQNHLEVLYVGGPCPAWHPQPVSNPHGHLLLQVRIPQLRNDGATGAGCQRPQKGLVSSYSPLLDPSESAGHLVTYLGMDSKRICFLSFSGTELRLTNLFLLVFFKEEHNAGWFCWFFFLPCLSETCTHNFDFQWMKAIVFFYIRI